MSNLDLNVETLLTEMGVDPSIIKGAGIEVYSPLDGSVIANLTCDTAETVSQKISDAQTAFEAWRTIPGPERGNLVRLFGDQLRRHKEALGRLVSIESGKIYAEGVGEVQEMIDICDFAVGLSRQLYGLTIASERPGHRMMETWHPLGVVGVISAFNFPVAVWSWNTCLALVCGDAVIWKPSEKSPLTAIASMSLLAKAAEGLDVPEGLTAMIVGDATVGQVMVDDARVALVSATGSTAMGKVVAPRVASRLGRYLLELGGNNAMIVAPSADLDLAVRAIVFSAVGTAGQRCTSLRRVIAHRDIIGTLTERLKKSYATINVGHSLDETTLVGPIIDEGSFDRMQRALETAAAAGGTVHGGERVLTEEYPDAYHVRPALVEMPSQAEIVREETFAPILYVMGYETFDEAIALQNGVTQGLSSCIFTTDIREAENFMSAAGSDCGLVNVNIGPSGAEIGGAFGGEKDTGGGRESGSDAWKSYMRRATNTINYSRELPLAQGLVFDID